MGKLAVALIAFSFLLTSCSVGSIIGGGNEIVAKTNANYVDYTSDIISNTSGDKVLFFHASWCGPCKSANKKIAEVETTTGLTVIKVDYDSNQELRKKYNVTSQHTFVQVDSEGNELAKWSGSKDINDIQSQLVETKESSMNNETLSEEIEVSEESMDEDNTVSLSNDMDMVVETEEVLDNESEIQAGKYVVYSESEVASTQGDKVLFFHATWCPACLASDKALSSENTPDGLSVFKVDYDSSTELKKKYGVVAQTTFVQIDDNGNLIKKWVGSRNYADILAELQS